MIFRFSFDSIPSQLRFIFALYKNLDGERDPDVELFILQVSSHGFHIGVSINFSFEKSLKLISITIFRTFEQKWFQTLKILCLHCEVMTNSRREHRGFLIWMHEHIIVPKLWTLLRSDYIQASDFLNLCRKSITILHDSFLRLARSPLSFLFMRAHSHREKKCCGELCRNISRAVIGKSDSMLVRNYSNKNISKNGYCKYVPAL